MTVLMGMVNRWQVYASGWSKSKETDGDEIESIHSWRKERDEES